MVRCHRFLQGEVALKDNQEGMAEDLWVIHSIESAINVKRKVVNTDLGSSSLYTCPL